MSGLCGRQGVGRGPSRVHMPVRLQGGGEFGGGGGGGVGAGRGWGAQTAAWTCAPTIQAGGGGQAALHSAQNIHAHVLIAIVQFLYFSSGVGATTQLWESTIWGKGTALTFGQEALSGLAAAIGMPGIQLTVLSLSHVDLGDTGMQLLCRGIGRYSMALTTAVSSLCQVWHG